MNFTLHTCQKVPMDANWTIMKGANVTIAMTMTVVRTTVAKCHKCTASSVEYLCEMCIQANHRVTCSSFLVICAISIYTLYM